MAKSQGRTVSGHVARCPHGVLAPERVPHVAEGEGIGVGFLQASQSESEIALLSPQT